MLNVLSCLKARYPLVYVVTHEERRVIDDVTEGWVPGASISTWSVTKGINNSGTSTDPAEVLAKIAEDDRQNSVWILKDFHPFLRDPTVVRALRDLCYPYRTEGTSAGIGIDGKQVHVVMISPTAEGLPLDLRGDVPTIEYARPGRDVLAAIAKRALARNSMSKADPAAFADALAGLTRQQARSALSLSIAETDGLSVESVLRMKAALLASDVEGIEIVTPKETLDDVAGLPLLVEWVKTLRAQFAAPEEAKAFGLPAPKGALLVGVPGGGKSLVAKALSNGLGLACLKLDMGALMGSLVGESEGNVRRALQVAEAMAPCILWADEIEKSVSQGQVGGGGDSGTSSRVIGTLITWLSEKTSPVFVVATANRPELLPPEMIRKGRFDEVWAIDLPDKDGRVAIFRVHLKKRGYDPSRFDPDVLAQATQQFSGAEIEGCVVAALRRCFVENRRALTTEDILAEARVTVPLATAASAEIEGMRAWAKGRARNAAGPSVPVVREEGRLSF